MTKPAIKIEKQLRAAGVPMNGVTVRNDSVQVLRDESDTDKVAGQVMQVLGLPGVKESWGGWVVKM